MLPFTPSLAHLPAARPAFLALPDDGAYAERLAAAAGGAQLTVISHAFPDGETYLRLANPAAEQDVAIVATLCHPNEKLFRLLLLADAVRQWGAERVGLVAPYLPYMRQDAEFHRGDAVTAQSFATLISRSFDWLVTIDPHLHRISQLSDIYTIPARALHAAPELGRWISANVESPVVIGPDSESRQWAAAVAAAANAPFLVLEKTRRGDADVSVSVPHLEQHPGRSPVLVDDIISTGKTMAAAVRLLRGRGHPAPMCVAVHAVFADGAYAGLEEAGASCVATTNTIPHFTNRIDITPLLARAMTRQPTPARAPGLS